MEKIFAQTINYDDKSGGTFTLDAFNNANSKFQFSSIGGVVNAALPYIIVFAGMGLLLMIILSGFSMLTSAGDAKKLESAKQRLTNGFLGLILILGAYWIVQILGKILGFDVGRVGGFIF